MDREEFEAALMARGYELKRNDQGRYPTPIELMWEGWKLAKGLKD